MEEDHTRLTKLLLLSIMGWWIIILVIKIIITDISTFAMQFRTTDRIIQGVLYMLMTAVCLIMVGKLYQKYKERKTEITLILITYFTFSASGAFLQGFFSILEFEVREFQTFFTDTAFLFISASSLALCLFIIEVFNKGLSLKKNRITFTVISLIVFMANIFISKNVLGDTNDLELLIPMGLSLIITIGLYGLLIKQALYLAKRVEGEINEHAFKLISLSGVLLIISYILLVGYQLTDISEIRYVNAFLFISGYYYLYKGFVLPMK